MAHTIQKFIGEWDTMHNNGPYPAYLLLDTHLDASKTSLLDRFNDASYEIRDLLNEALQKNEGFRAIGSRWSLSNIAHHKDRIHHNRNMNIIMEVSDTDMDMHSSFRSEDLFFLQCGVRIKEISEYLIKKKKALKTTGASNGQTIAGAISTGVHGSAIDVGGIQDYVVGINIINGPNPNDIIYIERSSSPALNDAFADKIMARIIRDDDIFNAALVSLGAFGFIHGVVIETEDIYLLKRYFGKISKANAIKLSESLDFDDAHLLIESHQNSLHAEVDSNGTGIRPYHYKLVLNPYNSKESYYVELMYKKPYRTNYPNPIPLIKHSLSPDILTFLTGKLANKRWAIPKVIKMLKGNIFPDPDKPPVEGMIGEIFWDALHQGPAFSFSVAVDHKKFAEVLDIFIETLTDKNKGYIPGAIGIRFVKGTSATLGFTRFPFTCIIEVDGTLPKAKTNSRKTAMERLLAFSRNVTAEFRANNIPFTFHWGKNADWGEPGLVNDMYGNKAKEWMQIRNNLFTDQKTANMFTNDFLHDTGLV
jgi:hypothetical protein